MNKTKIIFGLGILSFIILASSIILFMPKPQQAVKQTVSTSLTTAEVAKHNSQSDCWQIINGNVYNLTDEINRHPGGADRIIKLCGQDATEAYNTKDGRGMPHSAMADEQLNSLLVGKLGS